MENDVNPPLGVERLVSHFAFRRTGIWRYTPRATWCFVWNCRWFWLPSVSRDEVRGGWWVHWGWFMLEKFAFDEWDDWGEERAEQMADVLQVIAANRDDDVTG